METLEAIRTRRSIRKFTSAAIPNETHETPERFKKSRIHLNKW